MYQQNVAPGSDLDTIQSEVQFTQNNEIIHCNYKN